jgi:hypothetical protein
VAGGLRELLPRYTRQTDCSDPFRKQNVPGYKYWKSNNYSKLASIWDMWFDRQWKFWLWSSGLTTCSLTGGYQRFRGTYRLHLQGTSEPPTSLHDVITQKTLIQIASLSYKVQVFGGLKFINWRTSITKRYWQLIHYVAYNLYCVFFERLLQAEYNGKAILQVLSRSSFRQSKVRYSESILGNFYDSLQSIV